MPHPITILSILHPLVRPRGPAVAYFRRISSESVRRILLYDQSLSLDLQNSNRDEVMAEEPNSKSVVGAFDASGDECSIIPIPGARPNPLIDHLKAKHLNKGVLIPLKTTQEVRQDYTIVQAYITRAPTKAANEVIT